MDVDRIEREAQMEQAAKKAADTQENAGAMQ